MEATSSGTRSTISIHALLAESDAHVRISHKVFCRYFNPRSPCGERRLLAFRFRPV